jgi:hypothetical protein
MKKKLKEFIREINQSEETETRPREVQNDLTIPNLTKVLYFEVVMEFLGQKS